MPAPLSDKQLIRAIPSNLNEDELDRQTTLRGAALARWDAYISNDDAILTLITHNFQVGLDTARALLGEYRERLDAEAEDRRQRPEHLIFAEHRRRFSDLYQMAMNQKKLTTAQQAAVAMAKLDGAFATHNSQKRPVSAGVAGARTMSDEDLIAIIQEDETKTVKVEISG